MTYQGTLDWLYALDASLGMDFRLERLGPVLDRLGDPQRAFPAIHVAGTNGKGSTAAMLHSAYDGAGHRVGLYTSPHLFSFRERIRVGREMIAERDVTARVGEVRRAMDDTGVALTFFEIATLVALLEFRGAAVDLAVVEVGLGGRLDATNVVDKACTVITSIGLDHRAQLGDDIESVAWEKCGIIAPGVPLVTGELDLDARAVVAREVKRAGSPWIHYGRDFGPRDVGGSEGAGLAGEHQRRNAGVAAAVVRQLEHRFAVSSADLAEGLATTRWPGRLERLDAHPTVIVDAAHNPHAASCLRTALDALAPARPRVLLFGAMHDKDWSEMLCRLLPAFDHVVLVPVAQRRSYDPADAVALVRGLRPATVAASAADGMAQARGLAGRDGTVVVTGSIFLVAELYVECGGQRGPFGDATVA